MKKWKEAKQDSDMTCFMNPSKGKKPVCFARHSGSYVLSICAAREMDQLTNRVAKLVIGGSVG